MIAIFGSGFGLYGHLPALVELGKEVYLPRRYRDALDQRADLQQFRAAVNFVDDEASLLSAADLAVLVRRPADNEAFAQEVSVMQRPPQLVIEKPIAPTPYAAMALERKLSGAGVRHATPYLLRYCDWARDCKRRITQGPGTEIVLKWRFNSPKAMESWKATPGDGGGLVNYYFIHIIALAGFLLGDYRLEKCWAEGNGALGTIGMVTANASDRFTATFDGNPAELAFSVSVDGRAVMAASTPFGNVPKRGDRDPRIDVLKRFYTSEVFSNAADPGGADQARRCLEAWAELTDRVRQENLGLH